MKLTSHYTPPKLVKLTVGSILLSSSVAAQAASISYSTDWSTLHSLSSSIDVDNKSDDLGSTVTRSITQFDPALGTLDSISLSFYGMSMTSYAGANFRDDTWYSTVSGEQELRSLGLTIFMPGLAPQGQTWTPYWTYSRSSSCSATGGFRSGASCSTTVKTDTMDWVTRNFPPITWSLTDYIGPGSTQITIEQTGWLWTNETDGDNGYVNSRYGRVSASGNIGITYNFTPAPVPVPAATWLFGSGLLALIGVARRKKAA